MAGILFLTLGYSTGWWTPLVTGSLSAIWGLGFVGLMHYDFDPVMLVIPFILTARDISHGIQSQGRYYDEVMRLGDKRAALVATTDYMFPPGLLSILADIAGVIFISFGGIPVLHRIALAGAIWLAGSLSMVFLFQPIAMSFMPRPSPRPIGRRWGTVKEDSKRLIDRLARFAATPGAGRGLLLLAVLAGIIWGIASDMSQQVGYSQPGTPLYTRQAKINRDVAAISRNFPSDQAWIIVTTPAYPSPNSGLAPAVARMEDSLRNFLLADPAVIDVTSFASTVMRGSNQMLNYGFPKYFGAPDSLAMAGTLWQLHLGASAPGEMQQFFSSALTKEACIRVLLRDHTSATLNRLRARIDEFIHQRLQEVSAFAQVRVAYLGGAAGLYAAANDVLYQLDFINITFVLGVVFIFCVVTFRSVVAGLLFVLSCVLANFGAFIYLRLRDTGVAVLSTFAVMIGGVVLWAFSPLRFHSEMSLLLVFLMFTNMVSGVLILPCYIAWARPRFISHFERLDEAEATALTAAAS